MNTVNQIVPFEAPAPALKDILAKMSEVAGIEFSHRINQGPDGSQEALIWARSHPSVPGSEEVERTTAHVVNAMVSEMFRGQDLVPEQRAHIETQFALTVRSQIEGDFVTLRRTENAVEIKAKSHVGHSWHALTSLLRLGGSYPDWRRAAEERVYGKAFLGLLLGEDLHFECCGTRFVLWSQAIQLLIDYVGSDSKWIWLDRLHGQAEWAGGGPTVIPPRFTKDVLDSLEGVESAKISDAPYVEFMPRVFVAFRDFLADCHRRGGWIDMVVR